MRHFTLLKGHRKETVLANSLVSYLTKNIKSVSDGNLIVVLSHISS